jgi:Flp pilus assembly protein TadG
MLYVPDHQLHLFGNRKRRGVVAPLVAVSLIALLGIVALVVDLGIMQERKRDVQGSADMAALAAATVLFQNWYSGTPLWRGSGPKDIATAQALAVASANGYNNDGVTNTVTVRVADATVTHVNPSYPTYDTMAFPNGYAEVIITYNEPARFSGVLGATNLPVTARALARGLYVGTGDGVIILDPHASGALTIKGAGNAGVINVLKGSVHVDSDSSSAGSASGSHATVSDPSKGFVSPGGFVPAINFIGPQTVGLPLPDPLRALPDLGQSSVQQSLGLNTQFYPSGSDYTMNPGIYNGDFNPSGNVTLNPGIYVINGNVTMAGQGNSVTGDGVTFFFTGGFATTGSWKNAGWNITAPTTGPFAGIAFYQSRTSTGGINVAGNGDISITGTFYAPGTNVDFGGNGSLTVNGQYISNQLNAHGNGNINITYPGVDVPGPRRIQLVE